jgi:hypothetical protein
MGPKSIGLRTAYELLSTAPDQRGEEEEVSALLCMKRQTGPASAFHQDVRRGGTGTSIEHEGDVRCSLQINIEKDNAKVETGWELRI